MNSSDIAIRIENLGKRYRYGGAVPLSNNLRADIMDWLRGLIRSNQRGHETLHQVHERHIEESTEYFTALKDINLQINKGEVVGIIGRNGAGKSTLLKILSRITPPTTGKITYHGRISSLLEVGTGFHRELTGRENIFLNGSILGMKRAEITKNFDEIVAFAEVEKFIDTPVKFYSSGMYVRLAFAVAAHLEPEIMLVDEVLAVGDAIFQKKCLGKMGDVAKQGRTVLFVSHNMAAIRSLCSRSILLEQGVVVLDGEPHNAISQYLDKQAIQEAVATGVELTKRETKYTPQGETLFSCSRIALCDEAGRAKNTFKSNEPIFIDLVFECYSPVPSLQVMVILTDADGTPLLRSDFADAPAAEGFATFPRGVHRLRCELSNNSFGERRLYLQVCFICHNVQHLDYKQVLHFDVEFQGYRNNFSTDSKQAYFRPQLRWQYEPASLFSSKD